MKLKALIRKFLGLFTSGKQAGSDDLQPRDILNDLLAEVERRKKLGIEEEAFVPNAFAIYLSKWDYEEFSPLLTGIKEQLRNKLLEKIKTKGYRILSTTVTLDIREDEALEQGSVVVESSFIKEKAPFAQTETNRSDSPHARSIQTEPLLSKKADIATTPTETKPVRPTIEADFVTSSVIPLPAAFKQSSGTRIIEDKKTKFIDGTRIRLQVIDGESKGEIIPLKDGEHTFGRGRDAQVLIKDKDEVVSRVHFKICVRDDRANIFDLNSVNGTRVNDMEIEEAELHKGDTISAGKVLLKVV
jgi:hypothetical protein